MNVADNERARDSRIRIMRACARMLCRGGGEKLTVKAICDEAGVNRSTFYAHYEGLGELLESLESWKHRELLAEYRRRGIREGDMFTIGNLPVMFGHIAANRDFYRAILAHRSEFPIRTGFEALLGKVIEPACQWLGIASDAETLYFLVYFQAGFTVVLRRWIEGGCAESPEELAGIMRKFAVDLKRR